MMRPVIFFAGFAAACLLAVSLQSQEFGVSGPRALGMGGARVGNVSDASSLFYNPAGISLTSNRFDVRLPVTASFKDHGELKDRVEDLDDTLKGLSFDSASVYSNTVTVNAVTDILSQVKHINGASTGSLLTGLFACFDIKDHTFGIGVWGGLNAGVIPDIDLVNVDAIVPVAGNTSIGNNQSSLDFRGIVPVNVGLAYARSFFEEQLHLGVTVKMIHNTGYRTVLQLDNPDIDFWKDVKDNKETNTTATFDVGLMYVNDRLMVGLTGKNLTKPRYDLPGVRYGFNPQCRFGVSYEFWRGGRIAVDYDLTQNETLVPGWNERYVGFGVKHTFGSKTNDFLSELVTIRAGGYKNTAEDGTPFVPTFGFGIGVGGFRFDIAGAYTPRNESSGSLELAYSW